MTQMISIFPVPQDSARDFYKLGSKFQKAAQLAFEHNFPELDFPAYALIGQAIELYLKAFLRTKGVSVTKLKSVGHDLKRTFEMAEKNNLLQFLCADEKDRKALESLSFIYQNKDFHYKIQGTWELPFPQWTTEFAEKLSRELSRSF